MTTKQRSTSVSPYEIEQWDGPKTVVVKNPEGKIAYVVYGDEEALKQGYYAAQENPALFYESFKETSLYGTPITFEDAFIPSSLDSFSREEVEEILKNVDHKHSWKKNDTCRCSLSKE